MNDPEVLVFGATAAGVTAAVAAAGAGAEVVLAEPGRHVGGMVSGGLSWTDVGRPQVVAGLVRRFYELVAQHYGVPLFGVRGPEPHVAERLLLGMLEDAGVECVLGAGLEEVGCAGGRIDTVLTAAGSFRAGAVVDASYEGDVMAAAGVPYRVGRESRRLHGERWAGRQPAYRPGMHNFCQAISPFRSPGHPPAGGFGELVPFVRAPELDGRGWPAERLGEGDGGVQAYAFRLCMTDRLANGVELSEPQEYEPDRFELLARLLALAGGETTAGRLLGLVPDLLPGGKCDVNSIGPFSLNLLDGTNRAYPDGDAAARAGVIESHRRYSEQLLWFLGHDGSVPAHIRQEVRRWSLCADEFTDNGGWPHQLYVREGRRMVGQVVLTEHDLLEGRRHRDAVAVGSYNIDVREVERTWRMLPEYHATPAVFNEGYLSLAVPDYDVPYGVIVPREEDCANLLVPVCCSASQVAFGSLRTEPTLMALGEAAGVGGALAAIAGVAVQHVDVPRLQHYLVPR